MKLCNSEGEGAWELMEDNTMKRKNAFFLCIMLAMSSLAEAEVLNEFFYYKSDDSQALLVNDFSLDPLWSYPTTVMPISSVPRACPVEFNGLNMRCDTAYYQLKFDSPDRNTHAVCDYHVELVYKAGVVQRASYVLHSAVCQQDAATSLGCVIACEPLAMPGAGGQRVFHGLDVIIDEND